jgi:hypothetical protein
MIQHNFNIIIVNTSLLIVILLNLRNLCSLEYHEFQNFLQLAVFIALGFYNFTRKNASRFLLC